MFLLLSVQINGMQPDDGSDDFATLQQRTEEKTSIKNSEEKSSITKIIEHPATQMASAATWLALKTGYQVAKWGVQASIAAARGQTSTENASMPEILDESSMHSQASSNSSDSDTHEWDDLADDVIPSNFNNSKSLKDALKKDELATIAQLNTTTTKLCKNLADKKSQRTVHKFIELVEEVKKSNPSLYIHSSVANNNNKKQRAIIEATMRQHKDHDIPLCEEKYKTKMTTAEIIYKNKIALAEQEYHKSQQAAESQRQTKIEKILRRGRRSVEIFDFFNIHATEQDENPNIELYESLQQSQQAHQKEPATSKTTIKKKKQDETK